MRSDPALLSTLGAVRDRLIHPTPANLESCAVELERCVHELRRLAGSYQARAIGGQLIALARQITALHRQAGLIRFGAARLDAAKAAGYTAAGETPGQSPRPHVAVTG